MARTKKLQTIQTLAESTETLRSKAVADRRFALREEQRRLAQLEKYRSEYQVMSTTTGEGMCIHFVRGRRGFVDRLNEAIENQRVVVERAAEQLDSHLAQWRHARTRSLSLQKYAERQSEEEVRREERKEQLELDDMGRRRPNR